MSIYTGMRLYKITWSPSKESHMGDSKSPLSGGAVGAHQWSHPQLGLSCGRGCDPPNVHVTPPPTQAHSCHPPPSCPKPVSPLVGLWVPTSGPTPN
jgi:hypothetical protein